jgi:orotidine-5'-phosphate decarboxylase
MAAETPHRDRLVLALDTDDLVQAQRLVRELRPFFASVKVGLELFSAVGPDAVVAMLEDGMRVFLDLKLHDIPTTVGRAARVAGALGATYLTLHAQGGTVMLRAGVDGLREGAAAAGLPPPVALAVTVLTSDADAPPHIMPKRVGAALDAGCGGIVCAAADAAEAKLLASRLIVAVPGIRLSGAERHDQARAATPAEALAAGADLLVVGRAVTAARDRQAAAAALVAAMEGAS